MPLRPSRVTITGVVGLVYTAPTWATFQDPMPVIVTNRHATDSVYLGGPGVTVADGYELQAQESFSSDAMLGDDMYAITAGTSVSLHVLRGRAN